MPNTKMKSDSYFQTLYGAGVSPGIVIGKVRLLDNSLARIKHIYLGAEKLAAEQKRFIQAISQTEKKLVEIRSQFSSHLREYASVVDSHIMMLKDGMLYHRTLEIIEREGVNAEWAFEKALDQTREIFDTLDDHYLRARFQDVLQMSDKVFRILQDEDVEIIPEFVEPTVIVAPDMSPEDAIKMRTMPNVGLITESGGVTAHTAIIVRSLGVPAIMGVENITSQVVTGDTVIIDGSTGRIHLNPPDDLIGQYLDQQRQHKSYSEKMAYYACLAPETPDGLKIRLEANVEMNDEIGMAMEYGAGGIGLFRSEYYYITSKQLPSEEELFLVYKELLMTTAPLPVTIRTLDVGGDKSCASLATTPEKNPALGLRAIRLSLHERKIFTQQLRALYRAGIFGNLKIMFPMISSICEIKKIRDLLAEVKNDLQQQGFEYEADIPIGIMIEVPSAVTVADVLAQHVDFFSIGTNDLIQYALAIDRGNKHVSHLYEPLNPAVIRMIQHIITAGHNAGIEVFMCGELAGDMTLLPLLLGMRLDGLSMHPLAIPYIKKMIRSSASGEMEKLAKRMLQNTTVEENRRYLHDFLPRHYPEEFSSGILSCWQDQGSGGCQSV